MVHKIGNKIKQLREENNLSLEEVAANASLYPIQLSRIEQDDLRPTIAILVRIARALGTRLGTILDGEESYEPAMQLSTDRMATISFANNDYPESHLKFCALAQDKADRNMEPFLINVQYRSFESDTPSHHEGEEFIYVLEGNVVLLYGEEKFTLGKGDSIYYDSIVPHNLSAAAEGQEAKVLAVTYTPF